ncbi:patched family protein [Trichuris trichiura]|uniref:Patched family protein n=1 Tax=Trichuris trichiura TaxID=36087 RepID=A0A077Z163_TRITR|nr:patched family protein [Trichuris trichiura]
MAPIKPLSVIINSRLDKFYDEYGRIVGQTPYLFIVGSLLLTGSLSIGLKRFQQNDDLKQLYTPVNSPTFHEKEVDNSFWAWKPPGTNRSSKSVESNSAGSSSNGEIRTVSLFILLKSHRVHGNIFNSHLCRLVEEINRLVEHDVDITQEALGNGQFTFNTAGNAAHNYPARMLCKLYFDHKFRQNPNVRFMFPYMTVFGLQAFLGNALAGVKQHKNGTIGAFESFSLGYSWLTKDGAFDTFQNIIKVIEDKVRAILGNSNITFATYSDEIVNFEVSRNAVLTLPYLAFSCIALLAFCALSTRGSRTVQGKSWETLMGFVSSIMAIISSFGLLAYVGVPFNSIVTVTPFLALAIGIDDTFLAISTWQRTPRSLSPEQRLRMTMREAGSAITVSSLTDIALFGIGILSDTPAIKVFSIYTATAMLFDFIYHLTFVSACMVVGDQMNKQPVTVFPLLIKLFPVRNRNQKTVSKFSSKAIGKASKPSERTNHFPKPCSFIESVKLRLASGWKGAKSKERLCVINLSGISSQQRNTHFSIAFSKYSELLNTNLVKTTAFCLYGFYISLALWGSCKIKVNMSLSMLLVDQSPLHRFFEVEDEYIRSSMAISVHVGKPPANEEEMFQFFAMVGQFESMKFSNGPHSSLLWLRHYLAFCQNVMVEGKLYNLLELFLENYRYKNYANMIRWYSDEHGKVVVDRFFFLIYFSTNGDLAQVTDLMRDVRLLSYKFNNFNVTIFQQHSYVWDQYISIPENTIQTVGIGILCMIFMTAFFIPHLHSIFWVGFTLLSMDLGVIGFLSVWGVTLDPITMINIIMSLDFPVEYASHICHCFYRLPVELTKAEKLDKLLAAVGWPILQGGVAALLATLPLGFVPSYVVRVFFRTVLLTVCIGMLHALLWLPLFLVSSANSCGKRSRIAPKKSSIAICLSS